MMRRTLLCALGVSLFFSTGLSPMVAASSENPYSKIVDRNVFGLKPPSPPPSPDSLRPPAPTITLTGITTIGNVKRVLMRVPLPARPPEPAKEESLMITEGQRDGEIEVLEIDENAGTVKLRNYGTEMTLSLDKNGAKPLTLPAAALPMAIPTMNGGGIPSPNPMPRIPGAPSTTMPTRIMRVPGSPEANNPNALPTPGGVAMPGTSANAAGGAQQSDQISVEDQTLIIEAQRLKYKSEGNPIANILPPTALTPTLNAEDPNAAQGTPNAPQVPTRRPLKLRSR